MEWHDGLHLSGPACRILSSLGSGANRANAIPCPHECLEFIDLACVVTTTNCVIILLQHSTLDQQISEQKDCRSSGLDMSFPQSINALSQVCKAAVPISSISSFNINHVKHRMKKYHHIFKYYHIQKHHHIHKHHRTNLSTQSHSQSDSHSDPQSQPSS